MNVWAFIDLIFPLLINCSEYQTNFGSDYSKFGNYFFSSSSKSPARVPSWDSPSDTWCQFLILCQPYVSKLKSWMTTHTSDHCNCDSRTCAWIYIYVYIFFTKRLFNFFFAALKLLAESPQVWDNFSFPFQSSKVPGDWRKGNIALILKKSKKEDPGNHQPVCLTSVPMKIAGQIS